MRLLTLLTSIYLLCFFGFSTMIVAVPMGVEQTPFLKHMLQSEPPQSQNKITQKSSSHSKPKKKQSINKKLPSVVYSLIELICQCGGKKILTYVLPKHIRKARIVGFLEFVDSLSFAIGSVVIYGGTYTIVLKKEMLLMRWKTLCSSLDIWMSGSKKTKNSVSESQNEDQSTEESNENEFDCSIQKKPVAEPICFWAPPAFIKRIE